MPADNLAPDVYLQMGLLSMVDILCYVAAKFIVDTWMMIQGLIMRLSRFAPTEG